MKGGLKQQARIMVAVEDEMRRMSFAELHKRLGQLVADSTGTIADPNDAHKTYDANAEPFIGLQIEEYVRLPSQHLIEQARERMGSGS